MEDGLQLQKNGQVARGYPGDTTGSRMLLNDGAKDGRDFVGL